MKKHSAHKKLSHHLDKMGEHHKAAMLHIKELAKHEKLEGKAEVKKSRGRPKKDPY